MGTWTDGTGLRLRNVHEKSEDCTTYGCCIHSPTEHHMQRWPLVFRFDWGGVMERRCPHGIGHPDPDYLSFTFRKRGPYASEAASSHACDRCCKSYVHDNTFHFGEPDRG